MRARAGVRACAYTGDAAEFFDAKRLFLLQKRPICDIYKSTYEDKSIGYNQESH